MLHLLTNMQPHFSTELHFCPCNLVKHSLSMEPLLIVTHDQYMMSKLIVLLTVYNLRFLPSIASIFLANYF